jgi:hypothetical protein
VSSVEALSIKTTWTGIRAWSRIEPRQRSSSARSEWATITIVTLGLLTAEQHKAGVSR